MRIKRERLTSTTLLSFMLVLSLSMIGFAQNTDPMDSKRGAANGASFSLSDIENINLTNGNLMLNMPLVTLPKSRGGLSASYGLVYNSKLYRPEVDERLDASQQLTDQNVLMPSEKAGWQMVNSLQFSLKVTNRFMYGEIDCTSVAYNKNGYRWKVQIAFPDGSEKEFRPVGYTDYYDDNFYNISPNGLQQYFTYANVPPLGHTCNQTSNQTTNPIVYYSTDGTFTRMVIDHDSDGYHENNPFTLYFPDGSFYQSSNKRLTDRNGNYLESTSFTYNGKAATGIKDQFDRKVFTTAGDQAGETFFYQLGVAGAELKWIVRMKNLYVRREEYRTTGAGLRERGGTSDQPFAALFSVVDVIVLPVQLGGQKYDFGYSGSYEELGPTEYSVGWGELNYIKLPSGAEAAYEYFRLTENTDRIIATSVSKKTLTYLSEYSGSSSGVAEVWNYSIGTTSGTVTSPDGSVMTQTHGNTLYESVHSGLVKSIESANGTKVEKIWAFLGGTGDRNPFVQTEVTSIKNAAGAYTLSAIKTFTQDRNGNTTSVKEYGFVDYGDVPRTNGFPTGLPAGIGNPIRATYTEFYNTTPDSSDATSSSSYSYWDYNGVKNVVKSVEVRDSSNQTVSKTELTYDNSSTTANVTQIKAWDSSKGAYSNPLTTANSISTSATYNQYGMPLTTTDANNVVTTITYGCIDGTTSCSSTMQNLYPTKTEAASNHSTLKRTSTAAYDFYTGVVTTATDGDNNVSVVTEFDALGRPTKVRSGANTPLESWTLTTYDDVNRRVIVKSDLETKGDYKKVAIQHFDQLGRVRLARTLEDATTEDPYNEQHGIKVETRYQTGNPNSYQLTSNPFRAAYASQAANEATMGWTRSKVVNTGRHSEVETFSGAALPAPWGSNTTSTGKVQTDIDTNTTTVTDQAGKQRRSITNALGQLTRVDEPDATSGQLGSVSAPNQPTNYAYDILNNLTTVTQGVQTRSFAYNSLSRLTSATNPESGTINYGYDPNGNLTGKTDARGVKTDYVYDPLNRVTNRNYSTPNGTPGIGILANYQATPNVTYFYDGVNIAGGIPNSKGKLTKVESSVSTTEYTTFDILGRVTAHKQNTDGNNYTTGYVYNLSGALIEETYPSGRVVKNTLDSTGNLQQVQSKRTSDNFRNYANGFVYTARGAVSSLRLGNGKFESTQFNSRLQPVQIGLGSSVATQNLLKLNYDYGTTDNNGNVKSQIINTGTSIFTQTYLYDSLNRLTEAKELNASNQQTWKQNFGYDRFGNRTSFSEYTGNNQTNNQTPQVDPANNKFTTSSGFVYDLSGNVITDNLGRTFNNDGENKQTTVTQAGGTVGTYFYDGDGKRVKKVVPNGETTIFVYDATGKTVAEYSTVVEPSTTAKISYLTNDHLGSPRITTDSTGQVISRRDFKPFGEELARIDYGSDSVRKKFTGYERDNETGLDFAQARYHSANLGRFSSPDPYNVILEKERGEDEDERAEILIGFISNPQRWNMYVFVVNNPMAFTDPDGQTPRTINIFLETGVLSEKQLKEWKDWAAATQTENLKINIYEINNNTPRTVDAFLASLKAKDTATIFMGHSYHSANQMGISMSGSQIGNSQDNKKGRVSHTADGIDIQNTVVAIFSCGFGKGFANLTSSNGAAFVSIDQGQKKGDHKTTFAAATNATALLFAKSIAEGSWNSLLLPGNLDLARARSQSGINGNPHPRIPEVNRGDGVNYRILPPPKKKN